MIKVSALGSGSSGNSYVIFDGESSVVVDLGFSRRELFRRMNMVGIDPETVRGALITHEHDDHIKGSRVFCDSLQIPLFATAYTLERIKSLNLLPKKVFAFEPESAFDVGGFEVKCFPVPHDALSPVGFVIEKNDYRFGFATDLGEVTTTVKSYLRDCDLLALESNYDRKMLSNSNRPPQLKRRIAGCHGHLDNIDAAIALGELLTERTKALLLVHVSSECNRADIVQNLCRQRLKELCRDDLQWAIVPRETPLGSYAFDGNRVEFLSPDTE